MHPVPARPAWTRYRTKRDPAGPGRTKRDPAGPGRTKRDPAGPGWTRQDQTGPSGTRQDQTGPGRTRLDPAGPNGTQRDQAGPNGTQRDQTGPGRTKRDPAGPGRNFKDKVLREDAQPESAAPEASKERAQPESAAPEASRERAQPKSAAPEASRERAQPESAAPEASRERAQPESAAPEASRERAQPESAAPEASKERAQPESAAPEASRERAARLRKRKADVAIYLQDLDDEEEAEMRRKKKQSDCQLVWSPEAPPTSPHRWIPTPEQEEELPVALMNAGFPLYNFNHIFTTPVHCAPLPALGWASKDVVWNNMLEKDKTYTRDTRMLENHPHLQPKMRALLLDWLMEVSEVYKLHRETYHLAQDYLDRFMATQTNVFKSTLQLIGITSLFIAAKVEEMYPPKVHQFAYVTDEACSEDEILSMEIIIMKELDWSLSPQTPVSWLNVYMQVAFLTQTDELLIPRYPQDTFTHIAELLDLCMLDMRCLEFSNGVLAASALFHFSSLELVENVSALNRVEVEPCVRWMVPFAMALREVGRSPMKTFRGIPADDVHNIQTHASYMRWLDEAYSYQEVELERHGNCPVPSGVLTPPLSSEKTEDAVRVGAGVTRSRPRMCTASRERPE
ncbi:G1/S-specific cyclin-E1 [Brachionichthys hirsutus]|uniref:G1/S-specific cyclin-E1 n=1 Tax=Brachionichthys hirsutus TaxID=412623 RepID=UPI0036052618